MSRKEVCSRLIGRLISPVDMDHSKGGTSRFISQAGLSLTDAGTPMKIEDTIQRIRPRLELQLPFLTYTGRLRAPGKKKGLNRDNRCKKGE